MGYLNYLINVGG
ncbi:hypothetical protein LUU34_00337200 [Aix galericulata]|nr:hypothetical protein LUU34_00337200 [Aix galericulata]